jgi:hypothetical protein
MQSQLHSSWDRIAVVVLHSSRDRSVVAIDKFITLVVLTGIHCHKNGAVRSCVLVTHVAVRDGVLVTQHVAVRDGVMIAHVAWISTRVLCLNHKVYTTRNDIRERVCAVRVDR